ncbi:MAG: hypothetical protein FJ098_15850, partial [Deltaproteobacteria bacterium]|nr:hypothetical protein [Deltaproteobacteria bacterium]
MDPERRSSLVAAGAFVLTSALLVSFEGDAGSAATSRLYLHSAQAEARLHRAARGIMGDEATGTLPDPFADPEALVAGLHGVGVEDRGELLYSLAAASAAAGGLETARLLASRAGTPPEALLPLRFAWRDDSPVPADRAGLEEALDAAGLSAWSRLHLEALWLERTGDPALAEALRSELDAGDRAWIRRLGAAFTVLLLLGLTGALLLVLHRRLLRRWSEARPAFLQARFGTEPWETFVLFLLWFIGSQALGAALAHALRDVLPGGILILAVYLAGAVLGVLLLALFGIRGFRRSALSREVTGPGIAGLLSMAGLGLKDLSLRTVVWGAGGFAAALPVVWVLALLGLVLVGGDT